MKLQQATTERPGNREVCECRDESPTIRDAKERSDAYYDQTSEQKIANPDAVRLALWNTHLRNPALALAEVLRRVAVWDDAGSSTAGGRRC